MSPTFSQRGEAPPTRGRALVELLVKRVGIWLLGALSLGVPLKTYYVGEDRGIHEEAALVHIMDTTSHERTVQRGPIAMHTGLPAQEKEKLPVLESPDLAHAAEVQYASASPPQGVCVCFGRGPEQKAVLLECQVLLPTCDNHAIQLCEAQQKGFICAAPSGLPLHVTPASIY